MKSYHRIPGAPCKRQAPLALLLLLTLAGCKREGAPGSERVAASSSPVNSAPIVRQCYQGCLDINKGKPVDPQELSKNCAHKCTRICAKACAVPRKDLPYEQAMEDCSRTCKEQLGPT